MLIAAANRNNARSARVLDNRSWKNKIFLANGDKEDLFCRMDVELDEVAFRSVGRQETLDSNQPRFQPVFQPSLLLKILLEASGFDIWQRHGTTRIKI